MSQQNGPQKITFTETEKALFKPLYVQLATSSKSMTQIEAELGQGSNQFKKFKIYAAVMQATLKHDQTKQQVSKIEEMQTDLQAVSALQTQRKLHEQQIADEKKTLEKSRQTTAAQMTDNARTVKVGHH